VIQKLTPDRDVQCYFLEPSAVAALSSTSDSGFTLSGTWRQQFDWAVVEWNRDNTHEHPAFRYLPDGDLSGVVLSYTETRSNCIPLDSDLYATVDWPALRIWATPEGGSESIYWVPLKSHAIPVAGTYQCAYADFSLSGSVVPGDYVGLAFLAEHYTYQVLETDTLASIVGNIARSINSSSSVLQATASGTSIRVFYTGGGPVATSTAGANGNRFGMYSYSTGTETWDADQGTFTGGSSPTGWNVMLDFSSLEGTTTPDLNGALVAIPTNRIRKMRWTYAADLQAGSYARSEFQVVVSNWTVTGTNRAYSVAGPGSRRIEDNDSSFSYSGSWSETRGNFSGGTIHATSTVGDSVSASYLAAAAHTLYIGLRYLPNGAAVAITVDGIPAGSVNLTLTGEDVLFRFLVGIYPAGPHRIVLTHAGPSGTLLYFDFIELAMAVTGLPGFAPQIQLTLATDWDTEHSLALSPERTAWMIDSLGFTGRQNHYVGALWFYELVRTGTAYASGTVTFGGTPAFSSTVTLTVGRSGDPASDIVLTKLVHMGMTAAMMAATFAIELNRGYTGIWASAAGSVLTVWSRSMGADGNNVSIAASTTSPGFSVTTSAALLTGGVDGEWRTDLTALPRLNRAVRDWSLSFFAALKGYGIESTAAFSMELGNGDPAAAVGIAQTGPAGDPILLPTPSLQTNFSPASLAFWREVYLEMATLQQAAGLTPYLQFGEVQWWYFADDGAGHAYSGMPFYDAWTQAQFQATYGRPLAVIANNAVDPATLPDECVFLPGVIANFTNSVMSYVRSSLPNTRFEVLYPNDTNQSALNRVINYPAAWNPAALTCLKTESLGFTAARNLLQAEQTIDFGQALGFPAAQRSHLVSVGDSTTPWQKEVRIAAGKGFESVVLFALDQLCLIGYELPLPAGFRRSVRMGS
jgi:hypothetical protein